MTTDELEFQITQLIDETLPPTQATALTQRIATDPQTAAMLAQYQKLQTHLSTAAPIPPLNWDHLASHLSKTVSESKPPIASRTGWYHPSRFAIAAAVLIAITTGVLLSVRSHRTPAIIASQPITVIEGPVAQAPSGPIIEQITVGPSPALAARENSWRYAEGVVIRPSHINLAGAIPPAGLDSHIH